VVRIPINELLSLRCGFYEAFSGKIKVIFNGYAMIRTTRYKRNADKNRTCVRHGRLAFKLTDRGKQGNAQNCYARNYSKNSSETLWAGIFENEKEKFGVDVMCRRI